MVDEGGAEKRVSIEYFAVLREHRRLDREAVRTAAMTVAELYDELRNAHSLPLERSSLRVAVNDDFTVWDREIEDGDTIAFIPPVAGG